MVSFVVSLVCAMTLLVSGGQNSSVTNTVATRNTNTMAIAPTMSSVVPPSRNTNTMATGSTMSSVLPPSRNTNTMATGSTMSSVPSLSGNTNTTTIAPTMSSVTNTNTNTMATGSTMSSVLPPSGNTNTMVTDSTMPAVLPSSGNTNTMATGSTMPSVLPPSGNTNTMVTDSTMPAVLPSSGNTNTMATGSTMSSVLPPSGNTNTMVTDSTMPAVLPSSGNTNTMATGSTMSSVLPPSGNTNTMATGSTMSSVLPSSGNTITMATGSTMSYVPSPSGNTNTTTIATTSSVLHPSKNTNTTTIAPTMSSVLPPSGNTNTMVAIAPTMSSVPSLSGNTNTTTIAPTMSSVLHPSRNTNTMATGSTMPAVLPSSGNTNTTTIAPTMSSVPSLSGNTNTMSTAPTRTDVLLPTIISKSINYTSSRVQSTMTASFARVSPTSSSTIPTSTITPSPTSKITVSPTSSVAFLKVETYYEYTMSLKITEIKIKPDSKDEEEIQKLEIIRTLLEKCSEEYTEERTVYFVTLQAYLKTQICGNDEFGEDLTKRCELKITKLKCGSLIIETKLVIGVKGSDTIGISKGKADDIIKKEICEHRALSAFTMDPVNSTSKGNTSKPTPTEKPPQAEPSIYVIVTMKYTWKEFCGLVEVHFKEKIAERSYDQKGHPLKPSNIYIVNGVGNCIDPDNTVESIDVWFVIVGKPGADKLTEQVGENLKDLLDSRQTRKLGNLLEDKITKVEFGGKNAPQSSGMSDTEKIWLAVGICLAILLVVLIIYLCCTRKTQAKSDAERGPNYFAMDNIDGSRKEPGVLVNEGFEDQEGAHTPLSQRISTFKEAPLKKTETDQEVSSVPEDEPKADDDSKKEQGGQEGVGNKAPLGEGEDSTDDELGMTVADVAIEADSDRQNSGATPAGTLPIIPPDPTHMAIQDVGKFTEDTGGDDKRDKEYEDLDKTKTDPKSYPFNITDKNRTVDLTPKPETRVKLDGENDYINANFVKDHHAAESFIATQHPLPNTMRDFWSMVWKHDVSLIVMVNDSEKDLENFHNYWMDHKNSLTIYGHMQVKTESMETIGSFNVTKFTLQNSQESEVTKTIQHFRFTNWQDEGVPNVTEFAEFIQSVEKARLENPKSPIVVHCKDGQGFTGVAIAIDIGLRVHNESDKKSVVNIFDCVNKMRSDRNGIVSSKDLYKYIFKVMNNITDNASTADSKL